MKSFSADFISNPAPLSFTKKTVSLPFMVRPISMRAFVRFEVNFLAFPNPRTKERMKSQIEADSRCLDQKARLVSSKAKQKINRTEEVTPLLA